MRFRHAFLGISLTLAPAAGLSSDAADVASQEQIELGRQLFEESWLRPPADDSPLAIARRGDGLGPLFNGASCVECHRLGGVGGAGPNEHNVEIISLALPLDTPPEAIRKAMKTARKQHPGFLRETNVFLHRFGLDETGTLQTYADFREPLRSHFSEKVLPAGETQVTLPDGLPYQLSQRNTPALWGMGLVERISPEVVREVALRQQRSVPQLAGVPTDDGAGRYGWRGHMATLEQFVRTACAEELGMRVSDPGGAVHDQPAWPVDGHIRVPRTKPPIDLSPKQVEALVAFVRSLPAPKQRIPDDPEIAAAAEAGRRLFESTGCTVCHVPHMGPVENIFSDMLLHDMGTVFADRVAAPTSELEPRTETKTTGIRVNRVATNSYAGSSSTVSLVPTTTTFVIPPSLGDLTRATQAFRTPALWGVADSAPYLHDGRAETLDEAIRMHGGQAEPVTGRYAELPDGDRQKVLAFLGTLRAPQSE